MSDSNLPNPSPLTFNPLPLKEDWYLQLSTRAIWHQKRNVQADADGSHDERNVSSSQTLSYSFQEANSARIQTCSEEHGKLLSSGRDGKLESWMRETEWGIEDSSGEVRADWRARWILIYFPPTSLAPPHISVSAGIDILSSHPKPLADETIEEIRGTLSHMESQVAELSTVEMFQVIDDGSRDQERQDKRNAAQEIWQKRTGAAAGISPDLIYDDEDEEPPKSGKCIIQ